MPAPANSSSERCAFGSRKATIGFSALAHLASGATASSGKYSAEEPTPTTTASTRGSAMKLDMTVSTTSGLVPAMVRSAIGAPGATSILKAARPSLSVSAAGTTSMPREPR